MDLIDPLRAPRLLWQISLGVVAVLLIVRFVLRKRRRAAEEVGNEPSPEPGENDTRDG
ncbi:MAG: hypothetical protein KF858_17170 [Candidatus Sumerlaeia bacterium]|nr:hypothetical protein [Candidatus Sumerlaeia bacterium]